MKRAVIYVRVSSLEQVQNLSLGTQESICRDYCARNEIEVDRVFVEEGESAKTADRTEFQKMLEYCRQNKNRLQFVVVYTVNRFARNNEDHFAVSGYLRRLGISLRSATEPIDGSPSGKFMESMLAAVAALDNEMRRQNTLNGMKAALRIGRWTFQAPLGYRDEKDAGGKRVLVPDPERAPLVKNSFEMFGTGNYTKKEVLKAVTDLGLRTLGGNKVPYRSFENMLINSFYAGYVEVDDWSERHPGNHQPLISQELFDRVQAILAGRKPAFTGYQRNHPDFPLRAFARCGVCGHAMTGSWSKGRKRKYGYYSCNRYCRGVVIRKEVLEDAFIGLIQQSQPKPEMVTLFHQIVLDLWKNKQGERVALTSALQRQLTMLGERKQRLLDAYIHDRAIDRETYQQQVDKLEEELANARLAVAEAKYEDFDIEGVVAFAEQILTQPAKLWSDMSLDQRQRLQRVLFPSGIEITADKQIGTAEICGIFKVLDGFQAESTDGGSVVPLIATSWNQIIAWLRQIDQLRQAAVA